MVNHVIKACAVRLRDHDPKSGLLPLVPLCVSMQRLIEVTQDQQVVKQNRSPIVRLFELDHASMADMLKQAMEMRVLNHCRGGA